MDKVLKKRYIVLWIISTILPFIIDIILIDKVANGKIRDIISTVTVYLIPYLLAFVYIYILNVQGAKRIGNNKFSHCYVQGNRKRFIFATIATIFLIIYLFSLMTPLPPYTPLMMLASILYMHSMFRVIYVGEDTLVFINRVIKISEIDSYEVIDFFVIKGIRFLINGKKYEVNFESKRARDYVLNILNEKKNA